MTENQENSNFYVKNKAIIIGITLFFILICLSLYLAFIFFPDNFNSIGAIITFVETFLTSVITYILNEAKKLEAEMNEKEKERVERTRQKEKEQAIQEREQDLKLYERKIDLFGKFFQEFKRVIIDNQVSAFTSTNSLDELKQLLFLVAELRIYIKHESTQLILLHCNSIIAELKISNEKNNTDYALVGKDLFRISIVLKKELALLIEDDDKYSEEYKSTVEGNKDEDQLSVLTNVVLESQSPQATEKSSVSPDSQTWHVNVGEESGLTDKDQYRSWEDMKKFNFWSAGGAERYVKGVNKLEPGNIIYAYISGKGYVGKGNVKEIAKPVSVFFSDEEKKKEFASQLFKDHLNNPKFEGFYNPTIGEYAVKVEWVIKKDRDAAYKGGINISPQTICLMNQKNLEKLKEEFDNVS